MDYTSRIHIQVKSEEAWKKILKIKDINEEEGLEEAYEEDFDTNSCYLPDDFKNEEYWKINGSIISYSASWEADNDQMSILVQEVFRRAGRNCIVIGDSTNISVDDNTSYACAFGERMYFGDYCVTEDNEYHKLSADEEYMEQLAKNPDKEYDFYNGKGRMWGMVNYTDIDDIAGWLSYCGHFDFLSESEVELLKEFGIVQVKKNGRTEYKYLKGKRV